jgi:hypothetical protein
MTQDQMPAHFHRYLIDAYNARITGDYKAKSNLLPADSARLIKQAEEFLTLAGQLLGSPAQAIQPSTTPETDA